MKLRYTVEPDDLKAFVQYFIRTNAASRCERVIPVVCGAAITLYYGSSRLALRGAATVSLVSFVACATAVLSLYWIFSGRVSDRGVRRRFPAAENKGVLCEHTLELTDVGLTESSPVGQQTTLFAGVNKVVETPSHFLVFIGGSMAHVIPRKKILQGDADAFIEQLKAILKDRGLR